MKNTRTAISAILIPSLLAGCIELSSNGPSAPVTPAPDPDPVTPIPEPPAPQPPEASSLSVSVDPGRKFTLSWPDVTGADFYRLYERKDGISGYTQIGDDIAPGVGTLSFERSLLSYSESSYMIEACNDDGCTGSDAESPDPSMVGGIGYFKAINNDPAFGFGTAVAISGDGSILVVATPADSSPTPGPDASYVPGDGNPDFSNRYGSVQVYGKQGSEWVFLDYLKPNVTGNEDYFGNSVSVSDDGSLIAISSPEEGSASLDPNDNSALASGAVYLYQRAGDQWTQTDYIKSLNPDDGGQTFGDVVKLDASGSRLFVSAVGDDSNATGINGNYDATGAGRSGAVWVFADDGSGNWSMEAYIKPHNPSLNGNFGESLDVSSDGSILVVGHLRDDSCGTLVNDYGQPTSCLDSGAAEIFTRSGTTWSQSAYLKPPVNSDYNQFGEQVVISGDGQTIAVSTFYESSLSNGINSTPNTDGFSVGAAYLYRFNGTDWEFDTYFKSPNSLNGLRYGASIDISNDGSSLYIGAPGDSSSSSGLGGNLLDESLSESGAVFKYEYDGSSWSLSDYIKAFNPGEDDNFGYILAINSDNDTLIVSSRDESNATGIPSRESNAHLNNDYIFSGAVYLY